jgi:hypothetical protein
LPSQQFSTGPPQAYLPFAAVTREVVVDPANSVATVYQDTELLAAVRAADPDNDRVYISALLEPYIDGLEIPSGSLQVATRNVSGGRGLFPWSKLMEEGVCLNYHYCSLIFVVDESSWLFSS